MSWQVVRAGSAVDVNFALGHLEDASIPAQVLAPDGNLVQREHLIPVEDPVRLAVRAEDVDRAREVLDRELPELANPRRLDGTNVEPPARTPLGAAEDLGRRIRWMACSPFAPLGVLLAPLYAQRVLRAGTRPKDHGWTLAGIAVSALVSLLFALLTALG